MLKLVMMKISVEYNINDNPHSVNGTYDIHCVFASFSFKRLNNNLA